MCATAKVHHFSVFSLQGLSTKNQVVGLNKGPLGLECTCPPKLTDPILCKPRRLLHTNRSTSYRADLSVGLMTFASRSTDRFHLFSMEPC